MGAQPKDYSSLSITAISSGEVIRGRPHMFFGCRREDPRLAGAVVNAVVRETLGEPDRQTLRVEVVIESDHRFTITDNFVNEMDKLDSNGLPLSRWSLGALLAVSARAWIEIRTADRHWLQVFEGTTPIESPREREPIGDPGTRITYELDRDYFPATTVLPAAEDLLDPRDDRVIVTDLRG
ncbi:hypothetical protein ACRS5S_03160 [Nocardia asiatica]|uniref:hypothetical protein n=1 Tax=Nocardia asiatica TaxID=209252 RepID=UPI0024561735|nr:hypothetical protein [Nocardia asiatica]